MNVEEFTETARNLLARSSASHGKTHRCGHGCGLQSSRLRVKNGPSLRQVIHVLCLGFWTSEISEFGIVLECLHSADGVRARTTPEFFPVLKSDKMQLQCLDSSVCDYRAWPRSGRSLSRNVRGIESAVKAKSCLPSKAFPSCPHTECQT